MKEKKNTFTEHFGIEKIESSAGEDLQMDLGFQRLINTAIAQINNNTATE